MISRIINVKVRVISWSRRLKLIKLISQKTNLIIEMEAIFLLLHWRQGHEYVLSDKESCTGRVKSACMFKLGLRTLWFYAPFSRQKALALSECISGFCTYGVGLHVQTWITYFCDFMPHFRYKILWLFQSTSAKLFFLGKTWFVFACEWNLIFARMDRHQDLPCERG